MPDIVDAQRDRISMLEERIRQLEDALMPPTIVIPLEYRLTSSEARVYAHLASRDVATKQSIMLALYSDRIDLEPEIKIVDVFVCKMRQKLKRFDVVIETVWGHGYRLVRKREVAA
ncbi:two-component system cell cycle response regulator CtrA [Rhizobium sp. BK602]|nr:two-component system cell cycle response regulator CtrA [Rhizobium sp. BK602]